MQSIFDANNLENKTNFEERVLQNMRGITKGVVIAAFDKQTDYTTSETLNYLTDYAHSITVIVDGDGTVFLSITNSNNDIFKIRINTNETFDENFGDIKRIIINSTTPYRALVRR